MQGLCLEMQPLGMPPAALSPREEEEEEALWVSAKHIPSRARGDPNPPDSPCDTLHSLFCCPSLRFSGLPRGLTCSEPPPAPRRGLPSAPRSLRASFPSCKPLAWHRGFTPCPPLRRAGREEKLRLHSIQSKRGKFGSLNASFAIKDKLEVMNKGEPLFSLQLQ